MIFFENYQKSGKILNNRCIKGLCIFKEIKILKIIQSLQRKILIKKNKILKNLTLDPANIQKISKEEGEQELIFDPFKKNINDSLLPYSK